MILFLLAHAGGFAQAYRLAFKGLAGSFELIGLDLPGHGTRLGEPLLDNLRDMVADLGPRLEDELKARPGRPYAIFGHSLGGLLGYLITSSFL